jgi:hypothetical protein
MGLGIAACGSAGSSTSTGPASGSRHSSSTAPKPSSPPPQSITTSPPVSDVTARDMERALKKEIPDHGTHALVVRCEDIGFIQGLQADTTFACSYIDSVGGPEDRCFVMFADEPLDVTSEIDTTVSCEAYSPPSLSARNCGRTKIVSHLVVDGAGCEQARVVAHAYMRTCFTGAGCTVDTQNYHSFCESVFDFQREYLRVDCVGGGAHVFFQPSWEQPPYCDVYLTDKNGQQVEVPGTLADCAGDY